MKVSNCCGEKSQILRDGIGGYFDTVYAELCPKCGEHCEYVEEEKTQMTQIVIGCNYHTKWQSNKAMRFVLVEISGTKARLKTRNTGKDFWTNVDDLIFINSPHNNSKAQKLLSKK